MLVLIICKNILQITIALVYVYVNVHTSTVKCHFRNFKSNHEVNNIAIYIHAK